MAAEKPLAGVPLRVVFMGTPAFAVGSLDALTASSAVEVALVVTRPDAASGRGKALVPSPVKARALELGLPVLETKTLRTPEMRDALAAQSADVFCVAAFGAILPPEVLALPRTGLCLNVHASLLPAGRGAAPMQRALLEGEPYLGFSVMRMQEGLDDGPWCVQGQVEVGERTYDEVSADVAARGGEALARVLEELAGGTEPVWVAQDEARATHAVKLAKAEVLLDPALDAARNMWRVQASGEAAPARCSVAGRGVRVLRAHVVGAEERAALAGAGFSAPGAGAVAVFAKRLFAGCADATVLELVELKPDGKRAMAARDFAAGIKETTPTWEAV